MGVLASLMLSVVFIVTAPQQGTHSTSAHQALATAGYICCRQLSAAGMYAVQAALTSGTAPLQLRVVRSPPLPISSRAVASRSVLNAWCNAAAFSTAHTAHQYTVVHISRCCAGGG